jgi:hypothetical protein
MENKAIKLWAEEERPREKIKIITNLTCAILKSDHSSGTFWCSPKAGTMIQSKLDKKIGSRVYSLIFGSSIQKRPYSAKELAGSKQKRREG